MAADIESSHLADDDAVAAAGLVHRVKVPARGGPYKTLVMLHGRSGDENVMWIFERALPQDWLLASPRGIKPDPDGGYAWHPRKPDEWPALAMFDNAVSVLHDFIRALPALYDAAPHHIYLMGFSQGAATAYALAIRHSGLLQGIAGLVGFMPAGVAADTAQALSGLPVFMAVGLRDPLIPAVQAAQCATVLRKANARLTYREYETGHKLDAAGMADLQAWWREQAASGVRG